MYRPPFRQELPHIATGVAEDKRAASTGIGAAIKASAPVAQRPSVSAIVKAKPADVHAFIAPPSWL